MNKAILKNPITYMIPLAAGLVIVFAVLLYQRLNPGVPGTPARPIATVYGFTPSRTTDDGGIVPPYLDLEIATAAAGHDYVYSILDDPYPILDRSQFETGGVDPILFSDNIDRALSQHSVSDPELLKLFELERARIFAAYDETDRALAILEEFNEDDFKYNAQLGLYYDAMRTYYTYTEDPETAAEYANLYSYLPVYEVEI